MDLFLWCRWDMAIISYLAEDFVLQVVGQDTAQGTRDSQQVLSIGLLVSQHVFLDFGLLRSNSTTFWKTTIATSWRIATIASQRTITTNAKMSAIVVACRYVPSTGRKPTTISNWPDGLPFRSLYGFPVGIICGILGLCFFLEESCPHSKALSDLLQSQFMQLLKLILVVP